MEFKELFKVRTKNEERTKFMITIGNNLATEETFESEEEAQKQIDEKNWNLIASLIVTMVEVKLKAREKQ